MEDKICLSKYNAFQNFFFASGIPISSNFSKHELLKKASVVSLFSAFVTCIVVQYNYFITNLRIFAKISIMLTVPVKTK